MIQPYLPGDGVEYEGDRQVGRQNVYPHVDGQRRHEGEQVRILQNKHWCYTTL